MHALIIEDESVIAMEIENVLRDFGFNSISVAMSEADAVADASRHSPDLITCDVRLNPGSGVEAIRSICRRTPIPVIFLTGSPDEARARYPDHVVLTKPFTDAALRRAIASAMAADG